MNTDTLFSSSKVWTTLAGHGADFAVNLAAALLIFLIGRWLSAKLTALTKAALQRGKVDPTLASFIGSVVNIGLLIVVIIAALGKAGIPTTSLTALVGGAGLAVALSLKDQLSNFAAGALIILFRPFKAGDYIKINGFEGFVREIKMVQTSLRTCSGEEVVLPNSVVMSTSLINTSSLPLRRAQIVVNLPYSADLEAAKTVLLNTAASHPSSAHDTHPASVQITKLGDSSIELTLLAWTNEADWWPFQCALNEQAAKGLHAAGLK